MAPEVLMCKPYSFSIDYYALGIICYELLFGHKPYNGNTKLEIKQNILQYQVQISDIPEGFSVSCIEFINSLIQRKPENRLGHLGIDELKTHAFFKGYNWNEMVNKQIKSPLLQFMQGHKKYKKEDFSKWEKQNNYLENSSENIFKKFLYFDREAILELVNRKQSNLSTQKTLNLNYLEKKEEIANEAYQKQEINFENSDKSKNNDNGTNNIIIVEAPEDNNSEMNSKLSSKKWINVSKISLRELDKKTLGSIASLRNTGSNEGSGDDLNSNNLSENSSIRKFKKKVQINKE